MPTPFDYAGKGDFDVDGKPFFKQHNPDIRFILGGGDTWAGLRLQYVANVLQEYNDLVPQGTWKEVQMFASLEPVEMQGLYKKLDAAYNNLYGQYDKVITAAIASPDTPPKAIVATTEYMESVFKKLYRARQSVITGLLAAGAAPVLGSEQQVFWPRRHVLDTTFDAWDIAKLRSLTNTIHQNKKYVLTSKGFNLAVQHAPTVIITSEGDFLLTTMDRSPLDAGILKTTSIPHDLLYNYPISITHMEIAKTRAFNYVEKLKESLFLNKETMSNSDIEKALAVINRGTQRLNRIEAAIATHPVTLGKSGVWSVGKRMHNVDIFIQPFNDDNFGLYVPGNGGPRTPLGPGTPNGSTPSSTDWSNIEDDYLNNVEDWGQTPDDFALRLDRQRITPSKYAMAGTNRGESITPHNHKGSSAGGSKNFSFGGGGGANGSGPLPPGPPPDGSIKFYKPRGLDATKMYNGFRLAEELFGIHIIAPNRAFVGKEGTWGENLARTLARELNANPNLTSADLVLALRQQTHVANVSEYTFLAKEKLANMTPEAKYGALLDFSLSQSPFRHLRQPIMHLYDKVGMVEFTKALYTFQGKRFSKKPIQYFTAYTNTLRAQVGSNAPGWMKHPQELFHALGYDINLEALARDQVLGGTKGGAMLIDMRSILEENQSASSFKDHRTPEARAKWEKIRDESRIQQVHKRREEIFATKDVTALFNPEYTFGHDVILTPRTTSLKYYLHDLPDLNTWNNIAAQITKPSVGTSQAPSDILSPMAQHAEHIDNLSLRRYLATESYFVRVDRDKVGALPIEDIKYEDFYRRNVMRSLKNAATNPGTESATIREHNAKQAVRESVAITPDEPSRLAAKAKAESMARVQRLSRQVGIFNEDDILSMLDKPEIFEMPLASQQQEVLDAIASFEKHFQKRIGINTWQLAEEYAVKTMKMHYGLDNNEALQAWRGLVQTDPRDAGLTLALTAQPEVLPDINVSTESFIKPYLPSWQGEFYLPFLGDENLFLGHNTALADVLNKLPLGVADKFVEWAGAYKENATQGVIPELRSFKERNAGFLPRKVEEGIDHLLAPMNGMNDKAGVPGSMYYGPLAVRHDAKSIAMSLSKDNREFLWGAVLGGEQTFPGTSAFGLPPGGYQTWGDVNSAHSAYARSLGKSTKEVLSSEFLLAETAYSRGFLDNPLPDVLKVDRTKLPSAPAAHFLRINKAMARAGLIKRGLGALTGLAIGALLGQEVGDDTNSSAMLGAGTFLGFSGGNEIIPYHGKKQIIVHKKRPTGKLTNIRVIPAQQNPMLRRPLGLPAGESKRPGLNAWNVEQVFRDSQGKPLRHIDVTNKGTPGQWHYRGQQYDTLNDIRRAARDVRINEVEFHAGIGKTESMSHFKLGERFETLGLENKAGARSFDEMNDMMRYYKDYLSNNKVRVEVAPGKFFETDIHHIQNNAYRIPGMADAVDALQRDAMSYAENLAGVDRRVRDMQADALNRLRQMEQAAQASRTQGNILNQADTFGVGTKDVFGNTTTSKLQRPSATSSYKQKVNDILNSVEPKAKKVAALVGLNKNKPEGLTPNEAIGLNEGASRTQLNGRLNQIDDILGLDQSLMPLMEDGVIDTPMALEGARAHDEMVDAGQRAQHSPDSEFRKGGKNVLQGNPDGSYSYTTRSRDGFFNSRSLTAKVTNPNDFTFRYHGSQQGYKTIGRDAAGNLLRKEAEMVGTRGSRLALAADEIVPLTSLERANRKIFGKLGLTGGMLFAAAMIGVSMALNHTTDYTINESSVGEFDDRELMTYAAVDSYLQAYGYNSATSANEYVSRESLGNSLLKDPKDPSQGYKSREEVSAMAARYGAELERAQMAIAIEAWKRDNDGQAPDTGSLAFQDFMAKGFEVNVLHSTNHEDIAVRSRQLKGDLWELTYVNEVDGGLGHVIMEGSEEGKKRVSAAELYVKREQLQDVLRATDSERAGLAEGSRLTMEEAIKWTGLAGYMRHDEWKTYTDKPDADAFLRGLTFALSALEAPLDLTFVYVANTLQTFGVNTYGVGQSWVPDSQVQDSFHVVTADTIVGPEQTRKQGSYSLLESIRTQFYEDVHVKKMRPSESLKGIFGDVNHALSAGDLKDSWAEAVLQQEKGKTIKQSWSAIKWNANFYAENEENKGKGLETAAQYLKSKFPQASVSEIDAMIGMVLINNTMDEMSTKSTSYYSTLGNKANIKALNNILLERFDHDDDWYNDDDLDIRRVVPEEGDGVKTANKLAAWIKKVFDFDVTDAVSSSMMDMERFRAEKSGEDGWKALSKIISDFTAPGGGLGTISEGFTDGGWSKPALLAHFQRLYSEDPDNAWESWKTFYFMEAYLYKAAFEGEHSVTYSKIHKRIYKFMLNEKFKYFKSMGEQAMFLYRTYKSMIDMDGRQLLAMVWAALINFMSPNSGVDDPIQALLEMFKTLMSQDPTSQLFVQYQLRAEWAQSLVEYGKFLGWEQSTLPVVINTTKPQFKPIRRETRSRKPKSPVVTPRSNEILPPGPTPVRPPVAITPGGKPTNSTGITGGARPRVVTPRAKPQPLQGKPVQTAKKPQVITSQSAITANAHPESKKGKSEVPGSNKPQQTIQTKDKKTGKEEEKKIDPEVQKWLYLKGIKEQGQSAQIRTYSYGINRPYSDLETEVYSIDSDGLEVVSKLIKAAGGTAGNPKPTGLAGNWEPSTDETGQLLDFIRDTDLHQTMKNRNYEGKIEKNKAEMEDLKTQLRYETDPEKAKALRDKILKLQKETEGMVDVVNGYNAALNRAADGVYKAQKKADDSRSAYRAHIDNAKNQGGGRDDLKARGRWTSKDEKEWQEKEKKLRRQSIKDQRDADEVARKEHMANYKKKREEYFKKLQDKYHGIAKTKKQASATKRGKKPNGHSYGCVCSSCKALIEEINKPKPDPAPPGRPPFEEVPDDSPDNPDNWGKEPDDKDDEPPVHPDFPPPAKIVPVPLATPPPYQNQDWDGLLAPVITQNDSNIGYYNDQAVVQPVAVGHSSQFLSPPSDFTFVPPEFDPSFDNDILWSPEDNMTTRQPDNRHGGGGNFGAGIIGGGGMARILDQQKPDDNPPPPPPPGPGKGKFGVNPSTVGGLGEIDKTSLTQEQISQQLAQGAASSASTLDSLQQLDGALGLDASTIQAGVSDLNVATYDVSSLDKLPSAPNSLQIPPTGV